MGLRKESLSFFNLLCFACMFSPVQADQIIELLKKGVETGYVNAKVSMVN